MKVRRCDHERELFCVFAPSSELMAASPEPLLHPVACLTTGAHSRLLLCSAEGSPRLLKAIGVACADDEAVAERAAREINIAGRVRSPFVVPLLGWLAAPPEVCLLMSYFPGGCDAARNHTRCAMHACVS